MRLVSTPSLRPGMRVNVSDDTIRRPKFVAVEKVENRYPLSGQYIVNGAMVAHASHEWLCE